jgi:hypothetical protein
MFVIEPTEEQVVRELNKLQKSMRRVAHLLIREDEDRLGQLLPLQNLDHLIKGFGQEPEVADELIAYATDNVRQRETSKTLSYVDSWALRAANRMVYVPTPILWAYDFKGEGKPRVRFQHRNEVRCAGLIDRMTQFLHGDQPTPVGVYFQDETDKQTAMSEPVLKVLNDLGIRSSKHQLLWNRQNVAWKYLVKCFPVAIDLLAYGHSLMTPLVPYGFVPNCPVTFRRLKDGSGRDLGVDGSGIYHPKAPALAELMSHYGPVAMQFRYMHPSGIFCKGMLFPSEQAIDEQGAPAVVFDWLQVKGSQKAKAKERYEQDVTKSIPGDGFLGIFRYRARAGKMASCFEVLENIKVTPRTKEILAKKTQKAVDRILKRGPHDLLRKAQAKDENIAHMLRIVRVLQEAGEEIDPMQIDRIKQAAKAALGRELYQIAQGGGLRFRAHDARLDATIPVGKCVVSGYPSGVKVACIRFPTVLSQGLVTLETVQPSEHHMYEGETAPGVITMNPHDLVMRMQGDDDGDTIGVSSDPEVIELFNNLVDDRVYQIESSAKRLESPTESPDGARLMEVSQRGAVDRLTIMRASLLAVGDIAGANAISILIQEAVDRAKKIVQFSDWRLAHNIANWDLQDGVYKFSKKLGEEIADIGVLPIEMVRAWVNNRLIKHGCHREEKGKVVAANALTWKPQGGVKSIDVDDWKPTRQLGSFKGGNLVHWVHDVACRHWIENSGTFSMDAKTVDVEGLLYRALKSEGHTPYYMELPDSAYNALLEKSGLTKFKDELRKAISMSKEEDRIYTINLLQTDLERRLSTLDIEEQLTIWHEACKAGDVNNAMRAICWDGSPVLVALGLQDAGKCKYMEPERLMKYVDIASKDPLPHRKLESLVLGPNKHQEATGVPLVKCEHCMDSLQNALVRHVRYVGSMERREYMSELVDNLNTAVKHAIASGVLK